MSITTSKTQPALVGGVLMGVLSALPLIGPLGNICCCLWVVGGGALAAYLLQSNQAAPITPADGALVGLLAGLIGAVVHTLVAIPLDFILAPFERAMVERILDMAGNMPPDLRDLFERYGGRREVGPVFFIVGHLLGLMFWAFVGAVFSTLGGVVGAALFKKETPPGTIDVPAQP